MSQTIAPRIRDAGHGYDLFGLNPRAVAGALRAVDPLYRHYFRVTSHGAENIPAEGAAILAANHSGTLPIDGAMIYADVLHHTSPPRVPRPLFDQFVPRLPLVGTWFARVGAVNGTRANLHRLLDDGELVLVFPEGTPGIGKPFSRRYQLQGWRVGHAELAIRHRAPVVPVAVVGAEEQWPQIAVIRKLRLFGAPYLPVPLTPLPLPVRYHVYYGEPLALHDGLGAGASDDPGAVAAAAERVKDAVAALIARGLREREGVFA